MAQQDALAEAIAALLRSELASQRGRIDVMDYELQKRLGRLHKFETAYKQHCGDTHVKLDERMEIMQKQIQMLMSKLEELERKLETKGQGNVSSGKETGGVNSNRGPDQNHSRQTDGKDNQARDRRSGVAADSAS